MLECISIDFPKNLSFYESSASFVDRKKLRSMLLARRNVLRVICAPSLYGKSVLAFQYADQVFPEGEVRWFDATDPSFLLMLDEGITTDFLARYLDPDRSSLGKALFVIDGCPHLDKERFDVLNDMIAALLAASHEVILTTSDTRWLRSGELRRETIDAGLLLLDEHESKSWPTALDKNAPGKRKEQNCTSDASDDTDKLLLSIPGCRSARSQARQRFVTTQLDLQIEDEAAALSVIMLVLGAGALHELRSYVADLSNALLADLERHYPHAGITALSPRFAAIALSDRERFLLIQHHLSSLASQLSSFTGEEDLLKTVIDHLIERDAVNLAAQLVSGWHDEKQRAAFFDRHGRSFLFAGKVLVLLQLAKTLPRSALAQEGRWFTIAAAFALLDQREEAARIMRSFSPGDEPSEEDILFFSPELDQALARIVLGIDEERDSAYLASLALSCIRPRYDGEDFISSSRPVFKRDLSSLITLTLHDPCRGYGVLQKIASAGYAIKETMTALGIFLSLTTFVWGGRCAERGADARNGAVAQNGDDTRRGSVARNGAVANKERLTGKIVNGPESAGLFAEMRGEEERMLAELEGQLVHILSRQATVLPRNICELHLFDSARKLFGERIYLLVDDGVLGRIDALRQTLTAQREQWRKHRLSTPLIDLDEPDSSPTSATTQKKALRINTLGRFEIEPYDPDITIKGKVRKQLRLLISLLAINAGREIARPWVQRTMWPDAPDRNARQNLYTMWSLLNKSVTNKEGQCPFFESYPQSLALNSNLVETDTHLLDSICDRLRYEKLDIPLYERAIGEIEQLYRGPLLPGEESAEVVAHRKRYQDRLIEALLKGGETLRKGGETQLALRYFRFAFDTEPTREDVCYQLMLALWKLGRHGEALGEYFVCRRALIDSYGIEGTRKLRELYETILRDAS